jgi:hypothetical protein
VRNPAQSSKSDGQFGSKPKLSDYEIERQKNIEHNKKLLRLTHEATAARLGEPIPTPAKAKVVKRARKRSIFVPESERRRGRSANQNLAL